MSNRAWVTLATNDSYGLGALVLAHSLRRVESTHSTVVLITPSVTDAMRDRLRAVFTEVVTVDVLDSRDAAHLALLQRPELGITFTKIHCWGLTQYEKCVFLDADTLVVQNCDELFEREELSAAPDVGWPDCFNSGVFVYKPSSETFDALIKFAQERGSFDGGDQGLLNSFFSDWARGDINKHLPFLYNVTSAAFYSYLPALKHYGQDLKIIHFIGAAKPWLQPYNWESRSVSAPDHLRELLQLWWDLFAGQVHHQLDSSMVEDVEVEGPASPPADVGRHYAPRPDPASQFRWHRPGTEPQHGEDKPDYTDYYDPWQHYRGHIPPNPDLDASDDRQAVRDYAWEYRAPAQNATSDWHDEPHHTHSDHRDHRGDHPIHTHGHPDEHHGWHRHEAGPISTGHDHSHHHSGHEHSHGHTHTHYPHDHHHDHTDHPNHDHSHSEQSQTHNSSDDFQSHKDFTDHSRLHIVHHVHIDYENTSNEKREANVPVATEDMNGDASESESCHDHEDIKPRHPYDNYYLKHRAAIDPYGRKICSHEIPPPSPSPPPESVVWFDTEEEIDEDEVKNQSGVAGTLARVVPGAAASEALDELTRRQGWEAGNIDYMGADSFDNIWAKISQTLNRKEPSPPRQSPPREAKQPSPPKEAKQPSPPKEAPAEVKPTEVAAPVEKPAAEPAGKPTPVTPAAEAPAPAPAAPVEAPAPAVESPVAPVAAAPAEAVPPAEAPKEKTDKPEVPPTPPATPKSTPEPSTPVSEVPVAVEALLAQAAPAAEAPASPAPAAVAPAAVAPAAVAPAAVAPAVVAPASPAPAAVAPASPAPATPEKALDASAASTDSPPLANTPSKEEAPTEPAAKSEERERRKPAEKLQLSPPGVGEALAAATPDSELEDAAALAHAIIASELQEPAKVSLAQIGVRPKGKSTAAQIESSVAAPEPASPKAAPATPKAEAPSTPSAEAPATPSAEAPATPSAETPSTPTAEAPASPSAEAAPKDAPKKKLVKKVVKKEGDAPVPPPRKKEKKPKEK